MATMYPTEREERDWSDASEYQRGWNAAMDAAGLPHLKMVESGTALAAVDPHLSARGTDDRPRATESSTPALPEQPDLRSQSIASKLMAVIEESFTGSLHAATDEGRCGCSDCQFIGRVLDNCRAVYATEANSNPGSPAQPGLRLGASRDVRKEAQRIALDMHERGERPPSELSR